MLIKLKISEGHVWRYLTLIKKNIDQQIWKIREEDILHLKVNYDNRLGDSQNPRFFDCL
jgi:hypothetical protein